MASDNFTAMSVISDFRCCANEIRVIWNFTQLRVSFLPTGCPEKPVQNCHSTLGKIAKEYKSHSPQYFHSILTVYILVVSKCITFWAPSQN